MQKTKIGEKYLHIAFVESNIGIHKIENQDEEIYTISGTFIPFLNENMWCFNGKILKEAILQKQFYERKGYKVDFLICYDLDENGDFMSAVLRNSLVKLGVDINSIYRVPLTERGYISITSFLDIRNYSRYRKLDQKYRDTMKVGMGILKSIALYYIQKHRKKAFKITNNTLGTSTATVVYKENIRAKK